MPTAVNGVGSSGSLSAALPLARLGGRTLRNHRSMTMKSAIRTAFTAALSDLAGAVRRGRSNLGFFVSGAVDRVHSAAPSSQCVQGQQHESDTKNTVCRKRPKCRGDESAYGGARDACGLDESESRGHHTTSVGGVRCLHEGSLVSHRIYGIAY